MSDAIDVRTLLHDSPSFGHAEVEQLRSTLTPAQIGEVRRAVDELVRKVSGGNSSPRDRLALGTAAHFLGRHDVADQALAGLNGDGLAEFFRAQTCLALERYADAERLFEQAAEHGYDAVQCTLARAGAIRVQGRLDEAEQLLRSNARAAVTRADYSYQMGCLLSDRGDTFGAVEYFERAVDMDPRHTAALFRLANENNRVGNDAEAIRLYEQSLSRPPMYLGALLNLGLLYEDAENYTAAAYCFRRVLDVDPNHQRARLYLKDIEAAGEMLFDEDALRRQRELEHVLRIPLTDFELSARSRNCLERAGMQTLGDLTRITETDLLAGKNFGETSLREIREMMAAKGLRIGQLLEQPFERPAPVLRSEELSPEERAMIDTPVTDLNLSVRSRKCLSRLGVATIGELVARSADELLGVRNFGVTSLNEIRARLGERGMKLRND
ncbi:MAG TPA: DNA-directed RNA polymerase subunit alpha C-terminal domain-containing protein [Planctomycetaceae bacterium]|nr:DNA-directed RNA polymerase subunit alpha C-terminal domain-containing protein [Planctomycetaceae bacterium]